MRGPVDGLLRHPSPAAVALVRHLAPVEYKFMPLYLQVADTLLGGCGACFMSWVNNGNGGYGAGE